MSVMLLSVKVVTALASELTTWEHKRQKWNFFFFFVLDMEIVYNRLTIYQLATHENVLLIINLTPCLELPTDNVLSVEHKIPLFNRR